MKYAHILLAVASELWAMEEGKLLAMIDFLALKADGREFTAEEIEARITPQTANSVARREGAVAMIPLHGVISNRVSLMADISGGTSAEAFTRAVEGAGDDDGVKTIIIDVNSPGGTVTGVEEAAAAVAAVRGKKPIIAQVNAQAASAAYWIVSPADEIVVTPSGQVGAIGCMAVHDDVSKALEALGVNRTMLTSSPFKGEQASHLPLSEEARAHLQAQVDAYDKMFVDRVAAGRGVSANVVREQFGKGRMVMASLAVKAGMADRIATMDETLARFGVTRIAASGSQPKRSFPVAREKRALALNAI